MEETLIDNALNVHPYGLAVYGFLVAVLFAAVILLWRSNQKKDEKFTELWKDLVDIIKANTETVRDLKEVMQFMKENLKR